MSEIRLTKTNLAIAPIYDRDKIGSIWIPDQAKERCDQGIVKYKAPGCKLEEIKIGDHVIFSGYTGTLLLIEDDQFIIIPEEYITAIIHHGEYTMISGLYFEGENKEYIPATLDQVVYLIQQSIKPLLVTAPPPHLTSEDYEKLK